MYCRNCGAQMNDNQSVCLKCGVEAGYGKSFCHNCGSEVGEGAVICVKCGVSFKNTAFSKYSADTTGIQPRDLVKMILLSIVTCGIYGIIWFVSLTNEMNKLVSEDGDMSAGLSALLCIVTCGLFGVYWGYKMGEKRDRFANEKNSSNILYPVLMFFGGGIIVYALLQDTLNKAIEKQNH